MIDWDVEEPLHLRRVQVDRYNPVGAGALDQVRHELGRDRRAAFVLAVLARVAEVRDDGRHALALARFRQSIQIISSIRCAFTGWLVD
jgi:hypothetical protein